jgi:8-oxo-dGTP diphosphatase
MSMTTPIQDSATSAQGQQVITCVAFIHKLIDGKPHVMVARRADTKKFLPGVLELPGGHIDFGEDLADGLRREVDEELGIIIHLGDPFAAFTYTNKIKGSHSVEIVYFATLDDEDKEIELNPHDHSSIHWISSSNIDFVIACNGPDDAELPVIRKGLALLEGTQSDFGKQ